ncbi:MAG: hypothetical protein AB7G06_04970 [Bdellovibrionales bacterium]
MPLIAAKSAEAAAEIFGAFWAIFFGAALGVFDAVFFVFGFVLVAGFLVAVFEVAFLPIIFRVIAPAMVVDPIYKCSTEGLPGNLLFVFFLAAGDDFCQFP